MSKKRNKQKSPSRGHGIMATKERQSQNGGVVSEPIYEKSDGFTATRRHRAKYHSVLHRYVSNENIEISEYEAGLKIEREYLRSVCGVRVSDNGAGCHGDPEMRAISAINSSEVLRKAFAVLSPVQREIVISVCVDDKSAGTKERVKCLREALQLLISHGIC